MLVVESQVLPPTGQKRTVQVLVNGAQLELMQRKPGAQKNFLFLCQTFTVDQPSNAHRGFLEQVHKKHLQSRIDLMLCKYLSNWCNVCRLGVSQQMADWGCLVPAPGKERVILKTQFHRINTRNPPFWLWLWNKGCSEGASSVFPCLWFSGERKIAATKFHRLPGSGCHPRNALPGFSPLFFWAISVSFKKCQRRRRLQPAISWTFTGLRCSYGSTTDNHCHSFLYCAPSACIISQDTNTDLTLKLQHIIRNVTYCRHMNGRATIIQPSRESHMSIYTNIYLLNYTKVVAFFYLAQC